MKASREIPYKTFARNSARNLRAKFRAKFRAKLSREIPRENRTFRNRTLYRPREIGHSGTQSWTLRRQTLSESVWRRAQQKAWRDAHPGYMSMKSREHREKRKRKIEEQSESE